MTLGLRIVTERFIAQTVSFRTRTLLIKPGIRGPVCQAPKDAALKSGSAAFLLLCFRLVALV